MMATEPAPPPPAAGIHVAPVVWNQVGINRVLYGTFHPGDTTALLAALAAGFPVNARSSDGDTLLTRGASFDSVVLPLRFGADPDYPNAAGMPPLWIAAANANAVAVADLLAAGADVNWRVGGGGLPELGHAPPLGQLLRYVEVRRASAGQCLKDPLPCLRVLLASPHIDLSAGPRGSDGERLMALAKSLDLPEVQAILGDAMVMHARWSALRLAWIGAAARGTARRQLERAARVATGTAGVRTGAGSGAGPALGEGPPASQRRRR